MRLICTCSVCGSDDDWCETEDEDYYFCQYCKTKLHKKYMVLKNEFYGVMERDIHD